MEFCRLRPEGPIAGGGASPSRPARRFGERDPGRSPAAQRLIFPVLCGLQAAYSATLLRVTAEDAPQSGSKGVASTPMEGQKLQGGHEL